MNESMLKRFVLEIFGIGDPENIAEEIEDECSQYNESHKGKCASKVYLGREKLKELAAWYRGVANMPSLAEPILKLANKEHVDGIITFNGLELRLSGNPDEILVV